MDLIFPSGFRITLPEEAKEECEFIKTVLELEEVNEISINLLSEITIIIFKSQRSCNMKLYLIHTGFYDPKIMDGLYEQHTIFF